MHKARIFLSYTLLLEGGETNDEQKLVSEG